MNDIKIIELYKNQKYSIKHLALLNDCSVTKIRNLLIKTHNIEKRHSSDYHPYIKKDVEFFDKIDSEAKAYFLGLLITDGYLSGVNNNIGIVLQERDGYILEKFSDCIFAQNNVGYINRQNEKDGKIRQNQRRFVIVSKHMKETLLKYGITHNKWATCDMPYCHIPIKYFNHFVRGCIDGDGSIQANKRHSSISLIGSPKFIDNLFLRLKELGFNFRITEEKRTSKPLKYLICTKNKDNKNFSEWLYRDATLFLTRKKPDFNKPSPSQAINKKS